MIEKILKENKTYNALAKGSTKAAEKMLSSNESVIYAINANVSITPNNGKLSSLEFSVKNKLNGVVVITNERIFFCNSTLGNKSAKELNLKNIESIDNSTNDLFRTGKLRIKGITEMFIIDTKSNIVPIFQEKLNEAITNLNKDTRENTTDNYDKLYKLKKLLDDEVITQEEFEKEKQKLLQ